jgi:hypothetical protein
MRLNMGGFWSDDRYDWTTDVSDNEDFEDGDDVTDDEKAEIIFIMNSGTWAELIVAVDNLDGVTYWKIKLLEAGEEFKI